ncbi:MAG: C39 family peptidase [Patescibacteria group bacterium]|jgi:uncharacterized protein YvpB
MIKKTKLFTILGLILALAIFIGWVIFELSLDDIKGEENIVKRAYYQVTNILPVKPAVRLAVARRRQEHLLSCEIASLLMALNYRGVAVTENELIQQMPVSDPAPRSVDNIWGDPNLGFVGNINGKMPNTGYGVYEQPIYDLAIKYRDAKIINNASLNDLLLELGNGNPIVVWGVTGTGRDISWQTAEGKTISAKMNEHARTLIGYTGQSNQPKLMILLDPVYGEIRLAAADFLKNWAKLDNRAVVVY